MAQDLGCGFDVRFQPLVSVAVKIPTGLTGLPSLVPLASVFGSVQQQDVDSVYPRVDRG